MPSSPFPLFHVHSLRLKQMWIYAVQSLLSVTGTMLGTAYSFSVPREMIRQSMSDLKLAFNNFVCLFIREGFKVA